MNLFDLPLEQLKVYKPESTKEQDFDIFWDETLREALEQPLNDELKEVYCEFDVIKVYDVYYDGFKNSRIHAKYVLPKNAGEDKKLPAVALFHGYNWNNSNIVDAFKFTLLGYAVLLVEVRGQNILSPDHNHYDNGGAAGWMTKGILNPENYYYRYVYMDCVRAVEFLASREEVDSEKISVTGGSQGGALALATSALSERVKVVMADVPYLCHFRRAVQVSMDGPYNEIYHYFKIQDSLHTTEEQVYKTLSYFDNMNLATRIKAKALVSVGLEDTICPPSTVFAAYNNINSEKKIRVYPEFAHGGFNAHEEEKLKFLYKYCK